MLESIKKWVEFYNTQGIYPSDWAIDFVYSIFMNPHKTNSWGIEKSGALGFKIQDKYWLSFPAKDSGVRGEIRYTIEGQGVPFDGSTWLSLHDTVFMRGVLTATAKRRNGEDSFRNQILKELK